MNPDVRVAAVGTWREGVPEEDDLFPVPLLSSYTDAQEPEEYL